MLDPYAHALFNGRRSFGEMGPALQYGSPGVLGWAPTWPQAAAALPRHDDFDWEGDRPLGRPMEDLVIYEAHVRGFTAHPSSGVSAPGALGARPADVGLFVCRRASTPFRRAALPCMTFTMPGLCHSGTYQGLAERLDHLQALGITALELMPVHEFNELEYYQVQAAGEGQPTRYNFWGYSTVGFFAPMARFAASMGDASSSAADAASATVNEFRTLVKECHRRGIEVILDVVFNHTAEGNENGPTLSFRGIDNRVYYMLAPGGECYNYSGCGNTFNCNHPVAARFIVDCLRYWVEEMHVDGFRFDLGSIMTRAQSTWHAQEAPQAQQAVADPDDGAASGWSDDDFAAGAAPFSAGAVVNEYGALPPVVCTTHCATLLLTPCAAPASPHGRRSLPLAGTMTDGAGVPTGTPLSDPPLLAAISSDPVLARTKLIAEAWDCDGLNQVGAFPHYGGRWSEWNGHFRDTTRQFIKGTDGSWAGNFASALCGSPNIYVSEPGESDWWGNNGGRRWKGGRGPTASINFVTAHDGFTLADLVAYNEKHNEANGEDNRDGESHNLSWNCGEEGPSDETSIVALRGRQMRNFTAALLVAHGVPMMLMGDEYGHSKGGNNNTYCHDSPLNWLDWDAVREDEHGLLRFTRHMVALRRKHKELRRSSYVSDDNVTWHGVLPEEPDWEETSRFLAITFSKPGGGGLYVAFNTAHTPQMVSLPKWEGRVWQPVVDTGKAAPFDFLAADDRLSEDDVATARAALDMWTSEHAYPMLPWTCIVLESVPQSARAVMPAVHTKGVPVVAVAEDANMAAGKKLAPKRKGTKRSAKAISEGDDAAAGDGAASKMTA